MTHRAARRFELPVSGGPVLLRLPTGVEEMLLVETAQSDTGLALDLAGRLASTMDGEPLDWNRLPVTDLDAFVLGLRRAWVGDRIIADTACGAENCGARVDISFKISDYLAYHRPKRGGLRLRGWRVIEAVGDPGWYHLNRCGEEAARPAASFKLPTGPDLLAVEGRPDAADALARRCMGPAELPAGARSRVEAAMEALSPNCWRGGRVLPRVRRRCQGAFRPAPFLPSGNARPRPVRL